MCFVIGNCIAAKITRNIKGLRLEIPRAMLKPSAPPIASVDGSYYSRPQVPPLRSPRNHVQSPINPNFNTGDPNPSAPPELRIVYVPSPQTRNPESSNLSVFPVTNENCCGFEEFKMERIERVQIVIAKKKFSSSISKSLKHCSSGNGRDSYVISDE